MTAPLKGMVGSSSRDARAAKARAGRKPFGLTGLLLRIGLMVLWATTFSGAVAGQVTVSVQPDPVFIEIRGTEQRVNFDLLLHNAGPHALRINKIQVSVYDSLGALAYRRYLDENGRPSGIATLPNRIVPASGWLDVFNPFYAFAGEMPLARLQYEVFLESPDEPEPNLLNFTSKAQVEFTPQPYAGKTDLKLPLQGRLYVFDGHDFYAHHRRQNVVHGPRLTRNSVRFAYDFMITNGLGELYHGDRFEKRNWYSYGAPIFAPAAGVVADVQDGIQENSYHAQRMAYPVLPEGLDPGGMGNHVVIDHLNGEFSFLLHLCTGSVTVTKGEHVERGQRLGAIGLSGDTFVPHLHYTVLDGPAYTGNGLPSYFSRFGRVLGTKSVWIQRGQVDSGDLLENSFDE
ncbi:MAG TPA: M23 family metallopeptidase [Chthoniobacterales bacterium]